MALGIGLESQQMEFWQMALRAVIVYAVTLAMIRLGKKRFMGKATAFDMVLGIMLGSIVSRAITGNAPLVPALTATALIALHSALTAVACRWHGFGEMIKGRPRVIVQDGRKDEEAMRTTHLTDRDLEEEFRRHGMTSIEGIAEAQLERNGDISIIKSKQEEGHYHRCRRRCSHLAHRAGVDERPAPKALGAAHVTTPYRLAIQAAGGS